MQPPGPFSTRTPLGAALERLRRFCIAKALLPTHTMRLRETPGGTFPEPIVSASAAGSPISLYRYKSMEDDYIICRSWDGETEGDEDILIAKPWTLRFKRDSGGTWNETIDGITYTYSNFDTGTQRRTATGGSATETQVINRRYLVNDLIYAAPATTLVTVVDVEDASVFDLSLIDLNVDGRSWGLV